MTKQGAKSARTFVFLGISGSGKGTQAERLLRRLSGSVNVSTGDGFRRIATRKNLIGRYIRSILHRGGIVPYWGPAYVWLSAFVEKLRGDEHMVADGSPRLVREAEMLDEFMHDVGRRPPIAIYVRVSPREARRRLLLRGRHDDNRKAIAGRFQFFRRHVQKTIRYYRRYGRLITVNGDQTVQEVWRDIRKALRL